MKRTIFSLLSVIFMCGQVFAQDTQENALVLSLEDAINIAMSDNLSVKIADEEITIKRYAKNEVMANLLPQIDATASYQRMIMKQTMSMDFGGETQTIKVGSDNTFNGGVSAGIVLIGAQVWTSLKLSKLDIELALEKARGSRIDMIETVTSSYYAVLLAKESNKVYKKVYDNAVKNNENIRKKYEVGSVSEYDFITSSVSVKNAETDVIASQNAIVLALWQLKCVLGIELEKNIDTKGSLMDYQDMMNQAYTYSTISLDNNSSLKQLGIRDEMLQKTIKLRKMANVPTLSMNAAFIYTALGNDGKFFVRKAWNPYSYAGLQLSIPIFQGNMKRSALREAQHAYTQFQYQKEDTERQLRVGVVQCLSTMESQAKQFYSAQASVEQAQRGYDISVKRYDVGRGTLVEVDNSQVALTSAELNRAMAIHKFLTSKITLDKLMGQYEFDNNK